MFRTEPRGVGDNLFQRGRLLVRKISGRRGVPAFVLLLSLMPMFLFGPDRSYFYKPISLSDHPKSGDGWKSPTWRRAPWPPSDHPKSGGGWTREHDRLTRHHLAVAANLTAEHNFLGFYYRTLAHDGKLTYRVYNRFPVGGSLLIKLVILPFSDNLSAQLHAARLLMLVSFVGAALLAYLSLSRLTSSRSAAFGATLLSFASWQALLYSDMVMTETAMDLFGMMLVLHGMAVFCAPSAADGERGMSVLVGGSSGLGQLLVKTCVALLLGWRIYGLVLPFVGLGLAGALGGGGTDWRRIRHHLTLGTVALVFGVTVLGCNLARESFALEETPLLELPSVKSMLRRTGISTFANSGDWTWDWTVERLVEQFRRVGMASAPFALTMFLPPTVLGTLGVAVTLSTVGLLGLRSAPHRLPLAALALAGFCWTLPMVDAVRNHPHESLFYVGVPLVFFSLVLRRLPAFGARPSQTWVATGVVGVALAGFVISHWAVAEVKRKSQDVELEKALIADIHAIRPQVKNKVVFVPSSRLRISSDMLVHRLRYYYLTDSVVLVKDRSFADFVVAPSLPGLGSADSLTPENRFVFLYRPSTYNAALDTALRATRARYEHAAQTGTPVIESDYDVYHLGNELLYVGEEQACTSAASPLFFLHIYPMHLKDLPRTRRRYGFDNNDFGTDPFWQRGETCYGVVELPDYEIARISTGQYARNPDGSFHTLWEAHHTPPLVEAEKRS